MLDLSLRKKEATGDTYIPAKPCRRGHSLRFVSNKACVECYAIWRASRKDYHKEYMKRPGKKQDARDKAKRYKHRWQEAAAGRPRPDTCEVCGSNNKICWDHNHETGEFRGWICQACNYVLGISDDNPDRLRRLADYLEERS